MAAVAHGLGERGAGERQPDDHAPVEGVAEDTPSRAAQATCPPRPSQTTIAERVDDASRSQPTPSAAALIATIRAGTDR